MGSSAYLRFIQYVTFKYGDFQKASRISLREPFISINSIGPSHLRKRVYGVREGVSHRDAPHLFLNVHLLRTYQQRLQRERELLC